MGVIFDLAVAALTLLVLSSLALLVWTLGMGGALAVQRARDRVGEFRVAVANAEARLRTISK